MDSKLKKQKKLLQAPRGMHDILPEVYPIYKSVYEKAEEIAEYYGFSPIQTPVLERMEIFNASLGETSDIIEKEMYVLKTKGGDHLALRPEGTVGVMRAYLEHGMHTLPQPIMLWYKGAFFRHENPQKGRLREFQQFGMEAINDDKAIIDATIIRVLMLILEEIGVGPVIVHINSLGDKECRGSYRKELLTFYRKNFEKLCKNCKRRYKTNPYRLLDCKEEKCIEIKKDAPQMINHLCAPCKQHFKDVLEFLDSAKIPYFLDAHLVRGLDYYSRTVFEILEDKNKNSADIESPNEDSAEKPLPAALAGGGRYDYLAKTLSNKDFSAVGGAIGIDRVVRLMIEKKITLKKTRSPKILFIQIGTAAKYKSMEITEMLRKARLPIVQSISKDSLKGQLKIADKLNIPYVLILGQKEAIEDSIIMRDMYSRAQETIPIEKVVEIIKKKIK